MFGEFYDKQGRFISDAEYARLRGHPTYWKVAQDRVQGWLVSTVWLGLDHSYMGSKIPIIFETMVFPPESSADEYAERYATEEAALAGHQVALAWLLEKLGPEAVDFIDYEEATPEPEDGAPLHLSRADANLFHALSALIPREREA